EATEQESEQVQNALVQTMKNDEFWGVKEAAATALGRLHSNAARDALAEGARDADGRVRQAAVRALGSFTKDEKAAKIASTAYHKDRDVFVVAEAAYVIGRIQAKGAREFLQDAMKRNSDQDVIRRYAIRGFGELGDKK